MWLQDQLGPPGQRIGAVFTGQQHRARDVGAYQLLIGRVEFGKVLPQPGQRQLVAQQPGRRGGEAADVAGPHHGLDRVPAGARWCGVGHEHPQHVRHRLTGHQQSLPVVDVQPVQPVRDQLDAGGRRPGHHRLQVAQEVTGIGRPGVAHRPIHHHGDPAVGARTEPAGHRLEPAVHRRRRRVQPGGRRDALGPVTLVEAGREIVGVERAAQRAVDVELHELRHAAAEQHVRPAGDQQFVGERLPVVQQPDVTLGHAQRPAQLARRVRPAPAGLQDQPADLIRALVQRRERRRRHDHRPQRSPGFVVTRHILMDPLPVAGTTGHHPLLLLAGQALPTGARTPPAVRRSYRSGHLELVPATSQSRHSVGQYSGSA